MSKRLKILVACSISGLLLTGGSFLVYKETSKANFATENIIKKFENGDSADIPKTESDKLSKDKENDTTVSGEGKDDSSVASNTPIVGEKEVTKDSGGSSVDKPNNTVKVDTPNNNERNNNVANKPNNNNDNWVDKPNNRPIVKPIKPTPEKPIKPSPEKPPSPPQDKPSTPGGSNVDIAGLPALPTNFSIGILSSDEQTILNLVNQKRSEAGLHSLVMDDTLRRVARYKSNHMIQYKYFDHTTPQGEQWSNWLNKIGYKYSTTGENIAYNSYNAVELFTQWWNSPPHKSAMMSSQYNKIGVGVIHDTSNGIFMGTQTFSN